MNIFNFVNQYANQIGGQFTDYNHEKAVVVIPLDNERFQTILCITQKSSISGKEQVLFTSKVCEWHDDLDAKELLNQNAAFDYAKFILDDNFLKIETSCLAGSATEEQIKEMIQEVATQADLFELKYTGEDVH